MNRHRNGTEPRLQALIAAITGGSGGKRRRLEQLVARRTAELAAAKEHAERASVAKSRFLAAASHDLRQPLSALSVYVDVLENKLPAADGQLLANMRDCVADLSEMLADLLDLSKLEAGAVAPKIGDFAVDELLTRVVSAHAPQAESKGLSLRFNGLGIVGRTDALLFQRIVGNLVANAIRNTGQRKTQHARFGVIPVRALESLAKPSDLGQLAVRRHLHEARAAQTRVALAQCDHLACEPQHGACRGCKRPIEPAQVIVLTIGVVVTALRAQHFIAGEQHWHAAGRHAMPGSAPLIVERILSRDCGNASA
jgi:hypothetical protein